MISLWKHVTYGTTGNRCTNYENTEYSTQVRL